MSPSAPTRQRKDDALTEDCGGRCLTLVPEQGAVGRWSSESWGRWRSGAAAGRFPLRGGRHRALLAVLLLHPNEVVSADRLVDELWGEHPPPSARQMVKGYVSDLRRDLATDGDRCCIVTRAPGYVAELERSQLDADRFEALVAHAGEALAAERHGEAATRLREALALWRGPALVEFAYEPFAQNTIARLEDLRLVALEHRIAADLELGRHPELVGELESLVREHRFRERLRELLMLALYRSGRQAEALRSTRPRVRCGSRNSASSRGRRCSGWSRRSCARPSIDPAKDEPAAPRPAVEAAAAPESVEPEPAADERRKTVTASSATWRTRRASANGSTRSCCARS